MYLVAEELVSPGGPSAPVWIFITTTTAGIIALIGQQLAAKKAANEAKVEAAKAAVNSKLAQQNTEAISDGFANSVGSKLDQIIKTQNEHGSSIRHHLEWHLEKDN